MTDAPAKQYTMLRDKEIIVGVTGGIAVYKAAELVRILAKKGASVHVVMTKNAMEFVTPLTFQTLSGNPVTHEMFELLAGSKIGHIALSDLADQLVIVPATANIIGKIAGGIADDFLSTMVMATRVPVLFVPAMNTKMWESRIVQGNIDKLRDNGYEFIEPDTGDLACGWEGKGRMPPVEDIIEKMEDIFTVKDLVGERIMVTAGPTQEFIDPVRCITNRSSGKMGYALAKIAHRRGADVILVTGRTDLPRPVGVEVIDVVTATEMRSAVMGRQANCTVIIKAAAVADFRSKALRYHKMKKKPGEEEVALELDRNPDILQELGRIKEDRILVGFAAETENVVQNAYDKLKRKNLDLVVANDITKQGIGFGSDNNEVTIIGSRGRAKHVPKLSKEEVAHVILDAVKRVIKKKRKYKDDWY
jgi:phosphopantothenoylcysteine decarboxylase / phosphopantothenate---cysteine ligase